MHKLCAKLIKEEGARIYHTSHRDGLFRRLHVTQSRERRLVAHQEIEGIGTGYRY